MVIYDKYVYIHIPKAGGSSIRKWLTESYDAIDRNDWHTPMSDSLVDEYPEHIFWCTVRNPYAIVGSHYHMLKRFQVEAREHWTFQAWVEHMYVHGIMAPFDSMVHDSAIRVRLEDKKELQAAEFTPGTPIPHENKGTVDSYQSLYCTTTYDIVTKVYKQDLERHNYVF
jgi:hypothetical protein